MLLTECLPVQRLLPKRRRADNQSTYQWSSKIYNRSNGRGCPCCAGQVLVPGRNDLASQRPELAEEWAASNPKHPDEVFVSSHDFADWICKKCGYQWSSKIYSRSSGSGCPCCAGHVLVPGRNDLASQRPGLAEEWAASNPKHPEEVFVYSNDFADWICKKCGHQWPARVSQRSRGNGCPCCAGHVLVPGRNDLASQRPELVKDWAESNSKHPEEVFVYSNDFADWICKKCGHQWPARVSHRSRGSGCPCCAGHVLVPGRNDLASQRPELVKDWAESNSKHPEEVFVYSNDFADWICKKCGYQWPARIYSRSMGSGCPCCAGQILVPGRNDLASQRPELVKDWAESNSKHPEEVFVHSNDFADWICKKCGYQWPAIINSRSMGSGCPCCAGQVLVPGRNDLASQRPELVKDWAESNSKHPEEVFVYSNDFADWICKKCGYQWPARIYSRSMGSGCPCCAGQILVPGRNDLASQRPELVKDWAESNSKHPEEVFVHSNDFADWICKKCGYQWPAIINSRSNGHGCPACYGKRSSGKRTVI